jgi:DNA-3-methyladenine glycosylase
MRSSQQKLEVSFFRRPAVDVARDLLGTIFTRSFRRRLYRARIVETEAYIGTHDLACHASKGRTARTEVMFGPPGRAYVYFIYGMYQMLNVVTGEEGDAQAVLLRGAIPLDGWDVNLTGPGRLARAFGITRQHYGLDLTGDRFYFVRDPDYTPNIVTTPRIGVAYAGEWQHEPLRFFDASAVDLRGRPLRPK